MQRRSKYSTIAPMQRSLIISLVGLTALLMAHGMALIYRIQPGVALWFAPSGVAIALTFWFGPYGIVLTGVASLLMSSFWGLHGWDQLTALTDVIEPSVAWLLYRRLWRGSLTFNNLKDAAMFTLSVPLVASGSLAVFGSLAWVAVGQMPFDKLTQNIPHWWLGNAIGVMAITPTVLLVVTPCLQFWNYLPNSELLNTSYHYFNLQPSRRFLIELSAILIFCIATVILTVSETHQPGFKFQQLSFLSFVPVMWAATRFGVNSGMLISSFCVMVTLFCYLIVYPDSMSSPYFPVQAEVLHVHKLSLLVQCVVSLLVGVAITERARIQVDLAVERARLAEYQARAELSQELIEVNNSLTQTNVRLEESNQEKDELLKREQALGRRLGNILENMTDAFIAVNRDWQITYVNQQAARIQGVAPEKLIGKNYWDQWPATKGTKFEQKYLRSLHQEIPVNFETFYEKNNMWFEIRACPFEDGFGIFLRNITERKQAEVERENLLTREQVARREAEAANRHKDQFLAVLSHELRTPLNPILGWVMLLRSRKLEGETLLRGLETIERNTKLQIKLIEDLLDVSRIQQGKIVLNIQPINLVKAFEEALETVHLTVEAKNIQIKTLFEPNLGMVAGDAARLQQIFWNLLFNAVKFTPSGGEIQIRILRIHNFAELQIQDTGKGISAEFLPHIFDYFRQADRTITREFGGLGLGLAITRHLTELHGGTVKAESLGEGMGATFTVRLPLIPNIPQPDQNSVEQHNHNLNLEGLHILVVDDEIDTGDFLSIMLKQLGAAVTVVASAGEALEFIAKTKIDLLLSDIGLPGIDGYMLMHLIRAMPPEQGGQIPAIALTAFAGEMNQKQALSAGYQLHLVKPIEPEVLLKAITQVLTQPNPLSRKQGIENRQQHYSS